MAGIAVVLSAAGCATLLTNEPSTLPAPRMPSRHVTRVHPFVFTTTVPMERDDPLARDLLGLREAVGEALHLPSIDQLIQIVIFDDERSFEDYVQTHYPDLPKRRAFFIKLPERELAVLTYRSDRLLRDLRHETTHALLHAALPAVPLWLDEGLAEYFEVGPDRAGINGAHVERLRATGRSLDLNRLETMRDMARMSADDYRESWYWVRFCLHHDASTKQALLAHISRLRAGAPDLLAPRLHAVLGDPLATAATQLVSLPVAVDPEDRVGDGAYHPAGIGWSSLTRRLWPGQGSAPLRTATREHAAP